MDVRKAPGAMLPGAQAANTGSNLYWLALAYQLTPAFSVTGAAYYQDFRQTGSDPWLFCVMGDYTLSKRTDLYASVSYALNKDKSQLGVNGFNSGSGSSAVFNVEPGANQFGAVVGIRHRFLGWPTVVTTTLRIRPIGFDPRRIPRATPGHPSGTGLKGRTSPAALTFGSADLGG